MPEPTQGDVMQSVSIKPPRNKVFGENGKPNPVELTGSVKSAANNLYPVPGESDFNGASFLADPALKSLAYKLIGEYTEINHLKFLPQGVDCYWQLKGATTGGKHVQGKCVKPTGLLAHLAHADFIVLMTVSDCQGYTRHQVEALLYHELRHMGRDDQGKLRYVSHDVEAFGSEIARYGWWMPDLRNFGKAVQLRLNEVDE